MPKLRSGVISSGLLTLGLLAGCADRNIGDEMPERQLYMPQGIAAFESTDGVRLAVLSSNFDQRFQTQQISLLDPNALIDGVLQELEVSAENACTDAAAQRPLLAATLDVGEQPVFVNRVRTPGVGTRLVVADDGTDGHWIYNTNIFNGSLFAIRRSESDELTCSVEGESKLANSDCSERHRFFTGGDEPGALARGVFTDDSGESRAYIAVGHRRQGRVVNNSGNQSQAVGAPITFLDEQQLHAVINGESIGDDVDENVVGFIGPAFNFSLLQNTRGPANLVFSHQDEGILLGSMMNRFTSGQEGGVLRVFGFQPKSAPGPQETPEGQDETRIEYSSLGNSEAANRFVANNIEQFNLLGYTNAVQSRGIALLETEDRFRIVASTLFEFARAPQFTSGIALLARNEDGQLEGVGTVSVGSEIGEPAIRPSSPGEPVLVYAGDLREDKIWVVDISDDVPTVVAEISGRTETDRRILSVPHQIAFVQRGEQTYAFATNFGNSTIAVLDVSDPSPQNHCILARVGRKLVATGQPDEDN